VQLGLGAGAITRFTRQLKMATTVVEINPQVVDACRILVHLPADGPRWCSAGDALPTGWPGRAASVRLLHVDLYDHEAAAPVLDDEAFYAACRRVLEPGGVMSVNLFGRHASFDAVPRASPPLSAADQVWSLRPTREGNTVVVAGRGVVVPTRGTGCARALIEQRFGPWACRPASGCAWCGPTRRPARRRAHDVPVPTRPPGGARRAPLRAPARKAGMALLLGWLRDDGWSAPTTSSASRAAPGPVTPACMRWCAWVVPACAHRRSGQALDTEALTEWLAGRCGLPYLRIDPLKADVGRVADVMSGAVRREPARAAGHVWRAPRCDRHLPSPSTWAGWRDRGAHARGTCGWWWPTRTTCALHHRVLCAGALGAGGAEERRGGQRRPASSSWSSWASSNKQLDANDQGVVQVVDWLWQYAFDQRASDIHLEPRRDMGAIRFRIDGVLHTVYQVPLTVMAR
jgi:hypothetical protein